MDQHLALPLLLVAGVLPQLLWWGGRCLSRTMPPVPRLAALVGSLLVLLGAVLQRNALLVVAQLLLLLMLTGSGRKGD